MKRRLTAAIACLSIIAGVILLARSQGWQLVASVFSADGEKFNKASEKSEQIWIRRRTFTDPPVSKPKAKPNAAPKPKSTSASERFRPQLALDLAQRLRELGALGLVVAPAADAPNLICCRCQVEVPGTPYLRRFECRDASADLAGRGLLRQLEKWREGL